MIFYNENDKLKVVISTCNCGCGSEFHIQKFKETDEVTEYYLSLHSSKWDQEQVGLFKKLLIKLKRIWYIILNKDYLFMDVVFSEKEFKDFVQKLQDIQK